MKASRPAPDPEDGLSLGEVLFLLAVAGLLALIWAIAAVTSAHAAPTPGKTMDSFYIDLVVRLHTDAAAAASELIKLRGAGEPIEKREIRTSLTGAGRWKAHVHPFTPRGWVGGLTSDSSVGYASEVEALCSLIEVLTREVDGAGGVAPLHLLHRLEADFDKLATYRTVTRWMVHGLTEGARDALDLLDGVSETSDYGPELKALEGLRRAKPGAGDA